MNKEAAPFSQWLDTDWSAICYNINSSPHWQASLASALSCIFSTSTIHVAIDSIPTDSTQRNDSCEECHIVLYSGFFPLIWLWNLIINKKCSCLVINVDWTSCPTLDFLIENWVLSSVCYWQFLLKDGLFLLTNLAGSKGRKLWQRVKMKCLFLCQSA